MDCERYRIRPGTKVKLSQWDPDEDGGLRKLEGRAQTDAPRPGEPARIGFFGGR